MLLLPWVLIKQFQELLQEKQIRRVALRRGDQIRYEDLVLEILAPDAQNRQKNAREIHNNTIVFLLRKDGLRGLFTGDINSKVEEKLLAADRERLAAQLLKVSHHGSNQSTSGKFLAAVRPRVAVIGVGQRNSYGHPKQPLLERLQSVGASVYRTDKNGTVRVTFSDHQLKIGTQR